MSRLFIVLSALYVGAALVGASRAQQPVGEQTKGTAPTNSPLVVRQLPADKLLLYLDENGRQQPVRTSDDWLKRRAQIVQAMQSIMGALPGPEKRCPLDLQVHEVTDCGQHVRKLISYASEPNCRVPAYLLIPKSVYGRPGATAPAVLCLHSTNNVVGHGEVVGVGDRVKPNRQYANELADRGYVVLAPSYPLLAKYQPDLKSLGWESGTLKAVWDNIRGVDLLQSLPFVERDKLAAIGHSLGGHNAVFTGVFDDRLKAIVSSCGLDSFLDYREPGGEMWKSGRGWTQARYMPRLAEYRTQIPQIPFDFQEVIAALAPRNVFIIAPTQDDNFKSDSVDSVAAAANDVYQLDNQPARLRVAHPVCKHDFPPGMREAAYQFIDDALGHETKQQWHKVAANRSRRIILNNDGAEPVVQMTQPSAQEFLDKRTSGLIGSQVDSIFYCPRCSGFGMFTYFTTVGEVFTTREGRYENNQMEALQRAGIDPLRVIVDFCKQNKLEVFCSFRMNDNHDGTSADYAPLIFRANKFKNAHPELLLGAVNKRPKIGAWASVDYGQPEIRELAFRFAEEVCRNYDLDGVELDFFRHPVFFKSTSRGEKATDADRAAMTELVARIRKMADDVGKSRGWPILIAVRVPDSVEYCHALGLDLERWLADDLLDLYIAAGTYQLNNWDYSVALARKYGVKIYPSLDDSRVKDPAGNERRMTNLAYRGRAANVWAAGADGVYLYNFAGHFEPDAPLLREMGSSTELAKLDKDFLPASRGVTRSSAGNLPYEPYQHAETLNPSNPKKIQPGKTATAELVVGVGLDSKASARFKLRLLFRQLESDHGVQVKLRGRALKMEPGADGWLEATPAADDLRQGANTIEVKLSPQANAPIVWLDVLLEVRHGKKSEN